MENNTPLILVFYINRDTISSPDVIQPFIESINMYIEQKQFNIMSLFIPTDEKERVECINPVIASEEQINKINSLITDIETSFSIGDEPENEEDGQTEDTD